MMPTERKAPNLPPTVVEGVMCGRSDNSSDLRKEGALMPVLLFFPHSFDNFNDKARAATSQLRLAVPAPWKNIRYLGR